MFFGVDNTFLCRALDAGIFEPYAVAGARRRCPPSSSSTPTHRVTPIDYGDVCVNYDKQWFAKEQVAVPTTLDDLTKPAYKGQLVVENPATSSPGPRVPARDRREVRRRRLARLLASAAGNGVKVVDGWEQAYNGDFTQGGNEGTYPLVVSYASSPPAEVFFADPQPEDVADRHDARLAASARSSSPAC